MKQARNFPAATITKKAENSLRLGHPWVYDAEVLNLEGEPENGSLVDVFSEKGSYLGTGFISYKSKIRIRLLSSNANETFGDEFFARRIQYALAYRRTVMGPTDYHCCRLVFGEADGLPGLTVDRYENILVSQVLSMGMERVKDTVYRQLVKQLAQEGVNVAGIFERNDVAIRELEGLDRGWGR